ATARAMGKGATGTVGRDTTRGARKAMTKAAGKATTKAVDRGVDKARDKARGKARGRARARAEARAKVTDAATVVSDHPLAPAHSSLRAISSTKRRAPSPSGRSRDHTTSTHRSRPFDKF